MQPFFLFWVRRHKLNVYVYISESKPIYLLYNEAIWLVFFSSQKKFIHCHTSVDRLVTLGDLEWMTTLCPFLIT